MQHNQLAIYHLHEWYSVFVRNDNQSEPIAKKIRKFLTSLGYAPYTKSALELVYKVSKEEHDSI